jgi:hypothetical protein
MVKLLLSAVFLVILAAVSQAAVPDSAILANFLLSTLQNSNILVFAHLLWS